MTPLWYLVAFVVIQRLGELVWARYNTRRLMAEGATEHGRRHYPAIVLLHSAWIGAIALLVPPDMPVQPVWLGLFILLQIGRCWVILSLGRLWTTRIIVPSNGQLVARGPYRYLRHPNYLIVAAEFVALPMIFSAWRIAIVFSVMNAGLLWWRIRIEDRALDARRTGDRQRAG